MKCPRCNETLVRTKRQDVEIDYCPNCKGVWLDRGELDKLMAHAAAYASGPAFEQSTDEATPSSQREGPSNESQPHHKKKQDFLTDFFDLDYP